MDVHEFIRNHRYDYNFDKDDFRILYYYTFEKRIIDEIKGCSSNFALAKSRRMHITTLLAAYAAYIALTDERKKGSIFYFSPNEKTNKLFLNKVKQYVKHYNPDLIKRTTAKELQIYHKNNKGGYNMIITGSSSGRLKSREAKYVFIDEAAFIPNLMDIVSVVKQHAGIRGVGKIIAASTPNGTDNDFYKFACECNDHPFSRFRRITYKDNPRNTEKWAEETEKTFNDEIVSRRELHAEFIDRPQYKIGKRKNNLVQVRLSDEMMDEIGRQLIKKDVNISDYIRNLINEDIKGE